MNGSVTGVVTVYDPLDSLVKTPLEGIRVYVLNTDYKIDSVDYANNGAAIVDHALTGSDGTYSISGFPEGHYAVMPIPDSIMYRFEPEDPIDSVKFTISTESLNHSVNFTAAMPNVNDDRFQIRLTIINRPNAGTIIIDRPFFLFNIVPTFCPLTLDHPMANEMILNLHYGIFGHLYAVSNNLRIHARDGSNYYLFSCWIENNFFSTPAYSHWQIDWSAKTITRIE